MHEFVLLFKCGVKVMYVSDVTYPEELGQRKSMDLIWAFDFHFIEGGTGHTMIR